MTRASGIGSLPGEDAHEAARVVLGELPDLPHLPELPARGALADLTGRAVAVVADLGFDLQPAGWRLTDAAGVDHRRARSLLAQDLDAFEEASQGLTGTLKVQVAGPWTLAATVEKPRGDKVLSDHGARRDLAQALAEGVRTHLADVARRVPGVELVLQVDEPALPAVLAARVPTASGFGRHRSVTPPVASEALEWVLDAAGDRLTVVHCCDAEVPVGLLRSAGAGAVSVDVATLAVTAYDELATVLDEGGTALLGVLPATGSAAPSVKAAVERTMRLLDMLGLDPAEVSDRLVLTPACGLAGATPAYARAVLAALRGAAEALT
ncbi:methionine synthase [Marmoricola sp. Leaf446]|uniref:methionine synthase n=1 Tax=Marmoricola sp. Leaf446 TaxID=1736379 RepID=UPI0006F61F58|nr:methionine synthase [Marmoricola sp. Leaf446]KQT93989.1 methionine synthase [Marmoricola sp. Leaf446]